MILVKKHILENGLRLVHHLDKTTQMVAINVLYDVGSKDEEPDKTGFAHLFEHLMFGGSVHIPSYDNPIQDAGGENNAFTGNDITNYYISLPKQNAEIGFWLESDRMLSLDFSQKGLDIQKNVVIEEFKQRYLNRPYGDVSHILRSLAYKVHPYQWTTIGKSPEQIAAATLDDVKDFFYKHYAPNNAILTVSGNISFEETVRLTEKWFSGIERRKLKTRNLPKEPKQESPRMLEVERDVPVDSLFKAYHMVDRRSASYYIYDAISDILSNGNSSRLYRILVQEKQIFSEIDAYLSGDIEPGLFYITGKPMPHVTLQEAEKYLQEELNRISEESVTDYELEKVKNKFESTTLFNQLNFLNKAMDLSFFELLNKAEDINLEISNYRSVTSEQIKDVSKKLFAAENSNTLYYKARKS